jgi:hypothetical protein
VRILPAIAFASVALLGALAAGCGSTSQRAAEIPAATSQSGKLSLLQLQAAGKLPAPVRRSVLQRQLAQLGRTPRPHAAFRGAANVGLWAASNTYEYIFGQTANGSKTISAIDVGANGCYFNVGIKVDVAQNLWTACEEDPTFQRGAVQEYTNGTLAATYTEGCPVPSCSQWYSYGFDVAVDSTGHTFAALTYFNMVIGTTTTLGGGFEWWSSPSSVPTLIALPFGNPVSSVYFFDVDATGNIWFDYEGCTTSCGFGVGEIQSPTTTPLFVPVLPPGTIGYPGGVYVSKGGTVLNVTDQEARTISQYTLPWTPSETAFNVLGPTYVNQAGCGDPVSGGFNQNDTRQADGDDCGWLDVGKIKKKGKNRYSAVTNPNFAGLEGAAYVPSDK